MQKRLIELHQQRGRLLERSATERNALARQWAPLARGIQVGDRIAEGVAQARAFALQHPLAIAAVVAVVVVLRPRGVLRWSLRGVSAWRTWTALRAALPAFLRNFS